MANLLYNCPHCIYSVVFFHGVSYVILRDAVLIQGMRWNQNKHDRPSWFLTASGF